MAAATSSIASLTAFAAQSPSVSALALARMAFLSSVGTTLVNRPVTSSSAIRATVRSVGVSPATSADCSRWRTSSSGPMSCAGQVVRGMKPSTVPFCSTRAPLAQRASSRSLSLADPLGENSLSRSRLLPRSAILQGVVELGVVGGLEAGDGHPATLTPAVAAGRHPDPLQQSELGQHCATEAGPQPVTADQRAAGRVVEGEEEQLFRDQHAVEINATASSATSASVG